MRLPTWLARFNKHVTNRIAGLIAPRVTPLATVIHRGRVSGVEYNTTIMCWESDGMVTIVLTYGPDVDWLKNLVVAGGGEMLRDRRRLTLGAPEVIEVEEGLSRVPSPIDSILRTLHFEDFVEVPVLTSRPRQRD